MSSIYFKYQIIVVLETPIPLAISLVVTVIFIFDCDKNKLFNYLKQFGRYVTVKSPERLKIKLNKFQKIQSYFFKIKAFEEEFLSFSLNSILPSSINSIIQLLNVLDILPLYPIFKYKELADKDSFFKLSNISFFISSFRYIIILT